MRATLEFTLPEEREEFDSALRGGKAFAFIHDFEEFLRREYKHQELPEDSSVLWKLVRTKFFELKNDRGLCED